MDAVTLRQEKKGRAVRVIHYVGDTLWEKCGKPVPELEANALMQLSLADDQEDNSNLQALDGNSTSEVVEGIAKVQLDPTESTVTEREEIIGNDDEFQGEVPRISQDEMALNAFLISMHSMEVPVSASTLHSKYLLPQAKGLNFKETSWKKIAKFLKHLDKDLKLITTKELKNEVHVFSLNMKHELLREIRIPKVKTRGENAGEMSKNQSKKLEGSTQNKITITSLYQPIAALSFLFRSKDMVLSKDQVNQALEAYYEANSLNTTKSRRKVQLDPNLGKFAPFVPDNETEAKRDELLAHVLKSMKRLHTFKSPSNPMGEIRKGEFPRIIVSFEKRQGRKMVTIIKNLGNLFPLSDLQQEFSVKCASSVSIAENQLIIQGQQIKILREWVQEKGIEHLVDIQQKT
jgi:translation initiation factor 2D